MSEQLRDGQGGSAESEAQHAARRDSASKKHRARQLGRDADHFSIRLARFRIDATGRLVGGVLRALVAPATRLGRLVGAVNTEHHRQSLLAQMFGLRGQIVLAVGSRHPDHKGTHPDNMAASQSVLGLFSSFPHRFWRAMMVQDSPFANRLVLGSPTSTQEVAEALGFFEDGDVIRGTLPVGIDLPFLFGPRTEDTARRYVGGVLVDRPLTSLIDVTSGLPLPINGDRSGHWLEDDLVVVTHVPLMSSPWSVQYDLSYTNLAGVTGVGTRAGAQLLHDFSLQQTIANATGGAKFYQAVCRVQVEHRSAGQVYESVPVPGSLKLINAVGLDIDPDQIRRSLPSEDDLYRVA